MSYKHVSYEGMLELYQFNKEELEAARQLLDEAYAHSGASWFYDHLLDIGWLEGQADIARRAMNSIEGEAHNEYWEYRWEEFHPTPTPILFDLDDEEIII